MIIFCLFYISPNINNTVRVNLGSKGNSVLKDSKTQVEGFTCSLSVICTLVIFVSRSRKYKAGSSKIVAAHIMTLPLSLNVQEF